MPASDQGNLSGRYTLVPRTLIFLTCGDRILLLKGAPEKRLWANLYNGFGGHVERGEDVLRAALRELYEETGLTPSTLNLRGVIIIDAGQEEGIILFVFHGECTEEEAKMTGNIVLSKEGKPEWVKREDLDRLPLVEDLPVLLPRLLAMQPGDPPFSARYWYDESGRMRFEFQSGETTTKEK